MGLMLALCTSAACWAGHVTVGSPDGRLMVTVENQKYSVEYDGRLVVGPSALGLKTSLADFTQGLKYVDCHEETVRKAYDMRQTKASHVEYEANQLMLDYQTADSLHMQVTFLVSNNDVAFRYTLPRPAKGNPKRTIIYKENTAFSFPDGTKTFLCPQIGPETGWEQTKPSYEEEYKADDEMKVKSKFGRGYTFPCLFKVVDGQTTLWALVSETGVSGAYCGEIISPLSDATNFAAGVSGNAVFDLMRKTLPLAISALVTAEVGYLVLGHFFAGGDASAVSSNIEPILGGLSSVFKISPICMVPMAVMVACIVLQLPAIPSMLLGIIAGMLVAWGVQDASLPAVIDCAFEGYLSQTGNDFLDTLLSAGGMMSMTGSVTIVLIAMAFGGLMTRTGQMDALIGPFVYRIKSEGGMTALVVASCIGMNIVLPDQFLGISVPGQMFAEEYEARGITHLDLGRALLAGGAVTSPLIPWNTCGIYCSSILGIGAVSYLPFVFFSLITPVYMIIVGFIHDARNKHKKQLDA